MSDYPPSYQVRSRLPCPHCPSSDGVTLYSDGHTYCFVCERTVRGGKVTVEKVDEIDEVEYATSDLIHGSYRDLPTRKISKATCKKFGVQYGKFNGQHAILEGHYDEQGTLVAQKVRLADKKAGFPWVGNPRKSILFGQHLFPKGGKRIIITEGAIDALSYAEATDCKYATVSIKSGANGAKKDCQEHLQYLNSFEEIIIWFDNDKVGKEAALEIAPLFEPGKVKIVRIPESTSYKDCNDVLVNEGKLAVQRYMWEAQEYRPQGLVQASDLIEELMREVTWGKSWGWSLMDKITYGRRLGEIYTFGGAQGCGKTDILTQLTQFLTTTYNAKVGCFFMEAKPKDILERIIGKMAKKAYHLPDAGWTKEERSDNIKKYIDNYNENVYLYDNWGKCEWEPVKETIRYLNKAKGFEDFIIDNLTSFAAGADDEKKFLEKTMEEIASLANELCVNIYLVSHLATPEKTPHEAGGTIYPRHFKGSRAIAFWSHFMFGFERNQYAEDPFEKNTTKVVCLKDRFSGKGTGQYFYLNYDHETAFLNEMTPDQYKAIMEPKDNEQKKEDPYKEMF